MRGHERITLPLALSFPQEGSLLIETDDDGGKWVADVMNDVIFRLFTQSPPGKVHFTIIDPVGLGQNFAGLMHLPIKERPVPRLTAGAQAVPA